MSGMRYPFIQCTLAMFYLLHSLRSTAHRISLPTLSRSLCVAVCHSTGERESTLGRHDARSTCLFGENILCWGLLILNGIFVVRFTWLFCPHRHYAGCHNCPKMLYQRLSEVFGCTASAQSICVPNASFCSRVTCTRLATFFFLDNAHTYSELCACCQECMYGRRMQNTLCAVDKTARLLHCRACLI